MEEAERNAASSQHFIEGGEYHIAHPGAHFPCYCTAVGEEKPEGAAQGDACGVASPLVIAIFISHCEVVCRTHQGRVNGILRRAIEPKPLAKIVLVDRIEP